jgi:hypothetical protein
MWAGRGPLSAAEPVSGAQWTERSARAGMGKGGGWCCWLPRARGAAGDGMKPMQCWLPPAQGGLQGGSVLWLTLSGAAEDNAAPLQGPATWGSS